MLARKIGSSGYPRFGVRESPLWIFPFQAPLATPGAHVISDRSSVFKTKKPKRRFSPDSKCDPASFRTAPEAASRDTHEFRGADAARAASNPSPPDTCDFDASLRFASLLHQVSTARRKRVARKSGRKSQRGRTTKARCIVIAYDARQDFPVRSSSFASPSSGTLCFRMVMSGRL